MVVSGTECGIKINDALVRVQVDVIVSPDKIIFIQVACLCSHVLVKGKVAFKKMVKNFDLIGKIISYDLSISDWLPDFHVKQRLVEDQLGLEFRLNMLEEHNF